MNLKHSLNKNNVVNSIRFQLRHQSGKNKVFIIVEGETDFKLFKKFIDKSFVTIEIAHGVAILLKAVSELLQETKKIIGIRDADFTHLEGKKEEAPNIFLTDFHDMEMMILATDKAYKSVMTEFLTKETDITSFRQNILKSISFIGGIRWINTIEDLKLNFKNFGLGDFYNGEKRTLDKKKYLSAIMERSGNRQREVKNKEVALKIEDIEDFFNLCNGHDFQKAFALCVSANSNKGINQTEVGRAFRLVYRFEDFRETDLHKQLEKWAEKRKTTLFYGG